LRGGQALKLTLKNLFGSLSVLSVGQFSAQVAGFIAGIMIAATLNEIEYGTYRLLLILLGYLTYSGLGLELKIMYTLPAAIAKKNQVEIDKQLSIYHSFLIINRVTIFCIFIALSFFRTSLNGYNLRYLWILAGIIFVLDGWNLLYEIVLRSYQKFLTLGLVRIFYPFVYLFTLWVMLKYFSIGIFGILTALLLSSLFKIIFYVRNSQNEFNLIWSIKDYIDYIKYGFPVKMNSLIWMVLTTINMWISSIFLTPEQTATLGFALTVTVAYIMSISAISEITSVKFITYWEQARNKENQIDTTNLVYEASVGWTGLYMPVVLVCLLVFSVILNFFVLKYKDSWSIMLILIIGYYAYSTIDTIGNALILLGKSLELTKYLIFTLVLQTILSLTICAYKPSLILLSLVNTSCLLLLCFLISKTYFIDRSYSNNNNKCLLKLFISLFQGVVLIIIFWLIITFNLNTYLKILMICLFLLFAINMTLRCFKNISIFWTKISLQKS